MTRRYSSGLIAVEGREDRRHRAVDPDVDRPELALDRLGRGLDRVRVGHVGREGERPAARRLDLARRRLEPVAPPRQQADPGAARAEGAGRRAADARAEARDDDDLGHGPVPLRTPSNGK